MKKLFVYIGSCKAGFVKLYGYKFKECEPVEVENPDLIKKLQNNSHFEEICEENANKKLSNKKTDVSNKK